MLNLVYNSSGITLDYIKYLLLHRYNFHSTTNFLDPKTHQKFITYLQDIGGENKMILTPFINLLSMDIIVNAFIDLHSGKRDLIGYTTQDKGSSLYDLGYEPFWGCRPKNLDEALDSIENRKDRQKKFRKIIIFCDNTAGPIILCYGNRVGNMFQNVEHLCTLPESKLNSPTVVDLSVMEPQRIGDTGYGKYENLNKHLLIQVPNGCKTLCIFGISEKECNEGVGSNYKEYYNIPVQEFVADNYRNSVLVHGSLFEYLLGIAVCPLMKKNVIRSCKRKLTKNLDDKNIPVGKFYQSIRDAEGETYRLKIHDGVMYEDNIKEFVYFYNKANDIPFNLGYITKYNWRELLGY